MNLTKAELVIVMLWANVAALERPMSKEEKELFKKLKLQFSVAT